MPSRSSPWLTPQRSVILQAALQRIVPQDDFAADVVLAATQAIEHAAAPSPGLQALLGAGLDGLDAAAVERGQPSFAALSEAQQDAALRALEAGGQPGRRFFDLLRFTAGGLYAADPRLWARIGYPGAAVPRGGYPDYTAPPDGLLPLVHEPRDRAR
jgi:hypothetical protein